jgi:Fic family protein
MMQKPPYRLTPLILRRCQDIAQALGLLIGTKIDLPPLQLRRANNIKTIQASLAIEGNSLGEEQGSDQRYYRGQKCHHSLRALSRLLCLIYQ